MMKQKFGILLSFTALLILVGAGCAKTNTPAAQDANTSAAVESGTDNDSDQIVSDDAGDDRDVDDDAVVPGRSTGETIRPPEPAANVTAQFTMTEVAKHNSQSDCYIVVNGSVYDVTKFIPNHPGGPERIIPLCGKDATSAFSGQHGGQPQPEAVLASMKIGTVQK